MLDKEPKRDNQRPQSIVEKGLFGRLSALVPHPSNVSRQVYLKGAGAALGRVIILFITGYRYIISPFLGNCCRFYPSCSTYMETAIGRFGPVKGAWLGVKRLLHCHPWHPGGFDQVPKKKS